MKAELLSVLRDADDYVSGQDLCEKFGVSRTAVWKGINQLKEAGYEIEAVPNKGYQLLSVPDTLSEEELKSIRKTAWVGQEIFYYPVIDSTNTRAKQLAEEDYPTGTLVVAGQQDAGRGRRGRSFESPQGAGIFMTLMLKPELSPVNAPMLTLVAALAVSAAIVKTTGRPAGIKWPNDIYWNEKKICGILIENDLSGHHIGRSISGIGVNINQETFRSDAPNPVSLKQITGQEHERYLILANIMRRLKEYYILLQTDSSGNAANCIAERYARSLFRREGFHRYADADGEFLARLLCVEPDGRFILEDQAGKVRGYLFKEVQYIL